MPSGTWRRRSSLILSPFIGPADKRFVDWDTLFQQALGYDKRNESYVAVSIYERLITNIEGLVGNIQSDCNNGTGFSETQRNMAKDVVFCLQCRIEQLHDSDVNKWMTYDEIYKLKPLLSDFQRWDNIFPILIRSDRPETANTTTANDEQLADTTRYQISTDDNSTLLPKMPTLTGFTRVSLLLKKIALKDTRSIANPYIRISVRDKDSVNLTGYQSTQVSSVTDNFHVEFNCIVNVQQYIEKIPKSSNVFFELRYEKEHKLKTKCWAVLRRTDFKNLKGYLELYKPPADYHLKNCVKLSSKKPLYLHLDVNLLD